ncbi:MAG: phosphotransferase [Rhodobacteraceae bacterium]|nr:phosphotransferase [Paracoccaceae bacterium]
MEDLSLQEKVSILLKTLKLIDEPSEIKHLKSLSGGIASDVLAVDTVGGSYCVKFAIPKLRVEADWYAPVHRNRCEYNWLKIAEAIVPQNTPKMYGYSEEFDGFVMEYLSGDDCYMWKAKLLSQPPALDIAKQVAETLVKIQALSSKDDFDQRKFDTKDVFMQMRIDPYINYTGSQHPNLQPQFKAAAQNLSHANKTLVHGDVSPKNIMVKGDRAILIDADCASMGDPAFDVAFCLNHFFLKAINSPHNKAKFYQAALTFFKTYTELIEWESKSYLDQRTATYLPMLGLARVDGKSPVEYFNAEQQDQTRTIVIPLIQHPITSTVELLQNMYQQVN